MKSHIIGSICVVCASLVLTGCNSSSGPISGADLATLLEDATVSSSAEDQILQANLAGVDQDGNSISGTFSQEANSAVIVIDGQEFDLMPLSGGFSDQAEELFLISFGSGIVQDAFVGLALQGNNLNSSIGMIDSVTVFLSGNLTDVNDLPASADYQGAWVVTSASELNEFGEDGVIGGGFDATATFGTINTLEATFLNAATDGSNATLDATINGSTFSGQIEGTGIEGTAAGGFYGAQAEEIAGQGFGTIGDDTGVLIFAGQRQ